MSKEQPNGKEQPQQKQMSVDEQVSLMLAHVNRAINLVSKEAESALIKVVSQTLELQKNYQELGLQFEQYKKDNPSQNVPMDTSESKISPPATK